MTRVPWQDLALTAAVTGVAAVDAASAPPLEAALLLAAALCLIVRRRAPRLVLAACLALVLTYGALAGAGLFATLPVLAALYTVVAAGHRVLALAVAAALAAGAVGTAIKTGGLTQEALLPVGWLVAALLFGEVSRHRAKLLAVAQARAADAERTREEVAARRVAEERLRIARDLHDSLTHSISVITVQAGVAVHLARKRAEPVPHVLLAIQEAGRDAARELRETLSVLRVDPDGLDRLPALLDRTRGAGLAVTATTAGTPRPLPPDVDLAAYRIVQEALTNVTRHAAATAATVSIAYGEHELTVRVDDDGTGTGTAEPARPGSGITGMRERATALGGSLSAGRRDSGGFSVRADLPLPGEAS